MGIKLPARGDSRDNLVVRIEDGVGSGLLPWGAANLSPRQLVTFGNKSTGGDSFPSILGDTGVGGGTAAAVGGRWVLSIPSAAAIRSRHSNLAIVPLAQQFSGVDALVGALANRAPRQYTFEVPVRVTVAGVANVQVGLTISNGLLFGITQGVVWDSDAAVNGGRWLPRSRQTAGGAVTNGPDSGVASSAWHLVGFRYTERVNPLIEWLMDGVPLHTLTGDANMPALSAAAAENFNPAYGVNLPAGTTVQFGQAVYEVIEL